MPNHVRNVVKFKHLKPQDVDFILGAIAEPLKEGEPCYHPDKKLYGINFDKIIPEPRLETECPDDCKVNKDHPGIQIDPDRPWFDWYEFHNKYWDTKWNAYDRYSFAGKSYVTFVFSTAWSMPEKVIMKLTELGYDMEVKYADEDWGSNCGILEYDAKADFVTVHLGDAGDLPNPDRFARNLWNRY